MKNYAKGYKEKARAAYTIVEISGDKTPIRRVYLKRLIRQDNTGIWTVVGFDTGNTSQHSPDSKQSQY